MQMFDGAEVSAELDARLRAAGLNPDDITVKTIKTIVSTFFAERTSEVLKRVNEVLGQLSPDTTH